MSHHVKTIILENYINTGKSCCNTQVDQKEAVHKIKNGLKKNEKNSHLRNKRRNRRVNDKKLKYFNDAVCY